MSEETKRVGRVAHVAVPYVRLHPEVIEELMCTHPTEEQVGAFLRGAIDLYHAVKRIQLNACQKAQ